MKKIINLIAHKLGLEQDEAERYHEMYYHNKYESFEEFGKWLIYDIYRRKGTEMEIPKLLADHVNWAAIPYTAAKHFIYIIDDGWLYVWHVEGEGCSIETNDCLSCMWARNIN